jgi:DNA-3-methyladenine glycosylase
VTGGDRVPGAKDDRAASGPVPVIPRGFFAAHALAVAPRLLGCVLEHETSEGLVAVMLTEVEAYEGAADPASHAFRGRTSRNVVMFGEPGHAYVYFTYGMHFCANMVCQPEGTASAVLLRAGRVTDGIPLATARRTAGRNGARPVAGHDLARGPARLCQALAIDRSLDGADVCDAASPLRIRPPIRAGSGRAVPDVSQGPRVGISAAAERPWRFWLTGDPTVSPYRPHVPRARPKPVSSPATEDETMRG